ncbi:unnamed protein product [Candidula unifasciata]|uniref:NADH dehydrogenase [ubiquinone] 1 beta subcomplex subunit 6 n=1 Tax=Candidula unifasciata TaxID=100452 RepID=A0A8S3YY22_9EUPU|nr:unnamed protein product [Candidula unifasciata]
MANISKKADELKIDPVMEKPWQRAQRFEKYDYYCKSAYPPMQLEPLPFERNRLANGGMTSEQRALRKQWVNDQILHHEAREIPEVQPYNIFRRIYRWPADTFIFNPAKKFIGAERADLLRYTIPKAIMALLGSYFIWYQIKYHPSDWMTDGRVHVFRTKPMLLGEDAHKFPEKDPTDFNDRGFKSRKALLSQE